MLKNGIKKHLNTIFLIVIFALTIWSVFHGEDLSQTIDYLQTADVLYILPGMACVIAFIMIESVVISYLLGSLGTRIAFGHCCLYSFIGFFYSCITPSASGGQPMQIVAMRKDKIPVPVSTVVLALVTITYKLVLVVIGVTVMLIRPDALMAHLEGEIVLIYMGLALNVGCITLLLLLVFNPALVRICAGKLLSLINRIRPFKYPERIYKRLDHMADQYSGTVDYYRTHKGVMLLVFLLTLVQRMLLFMVTWFIYRAFGLSGDTMITVVLLQAMISVAVDMLPLPGGMGVSENLFLHIFLTVFGAELVLPGMVLSRGISYYTQLIISAMMTVAASVIIRKKD